MSTWTITVDFNDGGGARDIKDLVLVNTIRRKRRLWTELKPSVDTVSFSIVHDATIWNLFLSEEDDFLLVMTKDGSPYFSGIVYTNFDATAAAKAERMKIEAADPGILLKRKKNTTSPPELWTDYYVCNTAVKASSIVHQLLYDAGVADGDIDATDITTQLDFFINSREDTTYFDKLAGLLFEFGFVFYHDESGVFKMYNYLPTSVTPAETFDNTNLLDRIRLQKQRETYEGVRVKWSPIETLEGAIVFSDTTGGGEGGHKARIPIAAGEYYPPDSDSRTFYANYEIEGRELVSVENAVLDWSGDPSISNDTFNDYYKKAAISFSNGGAVEQYIYRFDIVGDAKVKGDLNFTKRLNVAGTDKILELEAHYLVTIAEAEKLSDGVARYYEYRDFTYEFESETDAPVGTIVSLDETETLGVSTTAVVVRRTVDERNGRYKYFCEGISAYSGRSTTTDGESVSPPAPVPGRATITPTPPSNVNLLGYWPLNGDPLDYSGRGRHGVLNGTSGKYDEAIVGKGYHFADDDEDVDLPDLSSALSSWTVTGWANTDTLSPTDVNGIILRFRQSSDGAEIRIYADLDNTDKIVGYINDGASGASIVANNAMVADTWYFVSLTYDGTTLKLYVNAILEASSGSVSGASFTPDDNHIGGAGAASSWSGPICQVRIYGEALSLEELTYLYLYPAGNLPPSILKKDPGTRLLRGYWPLTGSPADVSGRGLNGSLTLGSGYFELGIAGQALHFDGSTTRVTLPADGFGTISTWTISAYIYMDATAASYRRIAYFQESGGGRFELTLDSSDKPVAYMIDSSGKTATANQAIEAGKWYHVAGTYDGESIKLYVDAVLQADVEYGSGFSWSAIDESYIGSTDSGSFFDGLIAHVRLFANRVLDQGELEYLRDNPAGSTPAVARPRTTRDNLVAFWSGNDVGADVFTSVIRDNSGNGHNGIIESGYSAADGPFGKWIDFAGSSLLAITGSSDFDFGTGDFSLLAWFTLDTLPSVAGTMYLINATSTYLGNLYFHNVYDKLLWQVRDGGGLVYVWADQVLETGVLYHVACIRRDGRAYMYVNAVQQEDVIDYDQNITGASSFNLGGASTYEMDGKAGHFMIFDRALDISEIEAYYYNPSAYNPPMVSEYSIPVDAILDRHIRELDMTNPGISSKPSSNACMAMLGGKVAMAADTWTYAALEDANIYINEAIEEEGLEEGDTGTFAVTAGDIVTMDGAVAIVAIAEHYKLGHLLLAARKFIYTPDRCHDPLTAYIYAPYSSAYVQWNVDGGSYSNVSVARGTVVSQALFTDAVDAPHDIQIKSDAPIVVTVKGDVGDTCQLMPPSKEFVMWRNDKEHSWDDAEIVNRTYYQFSNDLIMGTSAGDGAGTDSEQGLSPDCLGDTYCFPHAITGYELVAIEPCTVRVYYWGGSSWTLYQEEDLTAASRENPVHISEGDSAGNGTPLASSATPWLLLGDGNFYARTNDSSSDEYPAIGYRRELRQFTFEQTIRALAGINVDGTVKTDKVVSDSILANAVITAKIAAGAVTADEIAANAVTAAKMNAENFFFTKAVGSENRETPAAGDVRAYLGKDPEGSQGTTDPVSLEIKEYENSGWRDRLRAAMRSGGNLLDMFVNGWIDGQQIVYNGLGLIWAEASTATAVQFRGVAVNGDYVCIGGGTYINRSTDGGLTWANVSNSHTASIYDLASDGAVFLAVGTSGQISRSTNSGSSWGSLRTSGFGTSTIYGVAIYSSSGSAVAVGASGKISSSSNGGSSWTARTSGVATILYTVAVSEETETYITGGNSGVIRRSTNGGVSWSSVTSPFGSDAIRGSAWGDGVFILTCSNGKIARSTDDGASFTLISDHPLTGNVYGCAYGDGVFIAADSSNEACRSLDLGLTWGRFGDDDEVISLTAFYMDKIAYVPDHKRFVAVGESGLVNLGDNLMAGSGIIESVLDTAASDFTGFIRFSSGLQICFVESTYTAALTTSSSGWYRNSGGTVSRSWPAAFHNYFFAIGGSYETGSPGVTMQSGTNTTTWSVLLWRGNSSASASRKFYLIGIGTWK